MHATHGARPWHIIDPNTPPLVMALVPAPTAGWCWTAPDPPCHRSSGGTGRMGSAAQHKEKETISCRTQINIHNDRQNKIT